MGKKASRVGEEGEGMVEEGERHEARLLQLFERYHPGAAQQAAAQRLKKVN